MVWKKANEQMKTKNIRPTVKLGRGSVLIWGCISASGVGELVFIEDIMKKEDYPCILQQNLVKIAEKLGIEIGKCFTRTTIPSINPI